MIQFHSETLWLETKTPTEEAKKLRQAAHIARMATEEQIDIKLSKAVLVDPHVALTMASLLMRDPQQSANEGQRLAVAMCADEFLAAACDPELFSFEEARETYEILHLVQQDTSDVVSSSAKEAIDGWRSSFRKAA